MTKTLLSLLFGLCSLFGYSQSDGKNELKVNFAYLVAGLPEISYERLLKPNTSMGISVAFPLVKYPETDFRWAVTPYYRMYFGKRKAVFFTEGHAILGNQNITADYDVEYQTQFGVGVAVGAKLWNKNGYFAEAHLGGGVFIESGDNYPRFGLLLGKRF